MMPLPYYLLGTFVLLGITFYSLATKRNMIRLAIAIDILSSAAHMTFLVFSCSAKTGFVEPSSHAVVIISIAMDGCLIAVVLGLVLLAYRRYGTRDVRRLRRLRE